MVFFILILLLITFSGSRLYGPEKFNNDYLAKHSTAAVNGIFVMLVLFSHYAQYADFSGMYDEPYLALREHLNQMVVATFLFYSGYGMMESVKRKGTGYVRKLPGKFGQLLLRFDIVVLMYIGLNSVLGVTHTMEETLLAFTSWTSVGNSNWYITAILVLYVIMFLSFTAGFGIFRKNERTAHVTGLFLTTLLTCAVVYLQIRIERPPYCYNTMLLLPLGCFYSEARLQIERLVMRSDMAYLITLALMTVVYVACFSCRKSYGITSYTCWAISFILMVLLVTMKFSISNGFLEWAGRNVFGIYILQRIPMIIMDHMGYISEHKYMSLVVIIAITFAIAEIYRQFTDRFVNFHL